MPVQTKISLPVITTVHQIADLVKSGFSDWENFGSVKVVRSPDDELLLFTYTRECTVKGEWNEFEKMSRGLIISRDGEIVARPFDKFFNWGEGGRFTSAPIKMVYEKIDGSLGILYRHRGEFRVATRGSFTSEQAQWATRYLQENVDLSWVKPEWTLLMEIVYPENRIVVDYGDLQALFLLAIRNRFTGEYETWDTVKNGVFLSQSGGKKGFLMPTVYIFDKVDDLLIKRQQLSPNQEGWVVEFADGSRFKFKGEEYLRLARLINDLTPDRVWELLLSNEYSNVRADIPEELLEKTDQWANQIEKKYRSIEDEVISAYNGILADLRTIYGEAIPRRAFAEMVLKKFPSLSSLLFAVHDQKDIRIPIFRIIKKEIDLVCSQDQSTPSEFGGLRDWK